MSPFNASQGAQRRNWPPTQWQRTWSSWRSTSISTAVGTAGALPYSFTTNCATRSCETGKGRARRASEVGREVGRGLAWLLLVALLPGAC